MKGTFEIKKKKEIQKYKEKLFDDLKNGKINSAYKALRELGSGSENDKAEFTLPSHVEENLTPLQSA